MKKLIKDIVENFRSTCFAFDDFMEIHNFTFTLNKDEFNSVRLGESQLKEFYHKMNIDYYDKLNTEIDHYNKLESALKHSIFRNKFFFGQGVESRKNVVLNDDCISLIQFFKRGDTFMVNVYCRSQHLVNLFFMDLYHIVRAVQGTCYRHNINMDNVQMTWFVANLHADMDSYRKLKGY